MKRHRRFGMALSVLGITAAVFTSSAQDDSERLMSGQQVSSEVQIVDQRTSADGSVSATLKNNTSGIIRDLKLLVTHTWYWKNERHPGDDNPGRSSYVSVTGEVPAAGTLAFEYHPNPPLPNRADGTFRTTVGVQSFTKVGE